MHQDPSGMLARIPFGLTTGPIEGAEILVAGWKGEISVHIAVRKSTSQNLQDEMSCWTLPSH